MTQKVLVYEHTEEQWACTEAQIFFTFLAHIAAFLPCNTVIQNVH